MRKGDDVAGRNMADLSCGIHPFLSYIAVSDENDVCSAKEGGLPVVGCMREEVGHTGEARDPGEVSQDGEVPTS